MINNKIKNYRGSFNLTLEGRNKLKWLISITLVFVLFGFANSSNAQVGTNNQFCPSVSFSEGMLNLEISPSTSDTVNFSSGLIGSIERINGKVSGGMDWMLMGGEGSEGTDSAPTNEIGSQLISWWSTEHTRTTKLQITNNSQSETVNVHVQIFDKNCLEVLDFCDVLTVLDTHVYDMGSLVTNTGSTLGSPTALVNNEGAVVITAVDECTVPGNAIEYNFLSGNTYISDSLGYTYGANMQARRAVCNTPGCDGTLTGSEGAMLQNIQPAEAYAPFSAITTAAGSDVVVMNIADSYGPPYLARLTASTYNVSIFDNNEIVNSCGTTSACFLRLGINQRFPARQDLGPPLTGP